MSSTLTGERNLNELKIPYVSKLTKVNGQQGDSFPLLPGATLCPPVEEWGSEVEGGNFLLLIVPPSGVVYMIKITIINFQLA